MAHFSDCSTVAANCNNETQKQMRDGTVDHFPGVEDADVLGVERAEEELGLGVGAEQLHEGRPPDLELGAQCQE